MDIKNLILRFKQENGYYPNTRDFDETEYLPSAKTIQRSFGGIRKIKSDMGLPVGDWDGRSSKANQLKTSLSMKKSDKQEKEIYNYLVNMFGIRNIHRESPYTADSKIRSDFTIYYHPSIDYKIAIDIFYPDYMTSLAGCINSKLGKIDFSKLDYEILMVNMNKKFDKFIDEKMEKRKTKLPSNVRIISKINLIKILAEIYEKSRI